MSHKFAKFMTMMSMTLWITCCVGGAAAGKSDVVEAGMIAFFCFIVLAIMVNSND